MDKKLFSEFQNIRWLINDVTVSWEFDNLTVVFLSTTKIINNY